MFHPFKPKKRPSGLICDRKANFSLSWPLFGPVGPHLGHSGSCKWSKLVCLNVLIGVPTLFQPFQPKIGPLSGFVWPKGDFSLFCPIFGHGRATFWTFLVLQMAQTGLSGCLYWCSKLVPPLPAQNRPSGPICVAKMLFLAYFSPFLAPVGPHLGHSGSSKWAKLINLDVLSVVPTSFQPVPLNRAFWSVFKA